MSRKNIVLITVDSLRRDYLGNRDSNTPDSPFLDNLAKDSIQFTNAYANGPYTIVSVPSFLTSKYVHQVTETTPTIAEMLKDAGYQTAAFSPNVRLFSERCRHLKLDRGFEIFDLLLDDLAVKRGNNFREFVYKLRRFAEITKSDLISKLISEAIIHSPFNLTAPIPTARQINEKASHWLKNNRPGQPFFVWLFYMDVHMPYLPPTESYTYTNRRKAVYLNRRLRYFPKTVPDNNVDDLQKLYRGEITYLDNQIRDFIKLLKSMDHYKDTIIIFTSDHGEQFREHGRLGHPGEFYEELLHVPLFIHNPELKKTTIDKRVSLLDLAPTIIHLATSKTKNFEGQNLLTPKYQVKPTVSIGNFEGTNYTIKNDHYRYIAYEERKRYELYDHRVDPQEKENILHKEKGVADSMRQKAHRELKDKPEIEKPRKKRGDQLSGKQEKQIRDRLRALGYLND